MLSAKIFTNISNCENFFHKSIEKKSLKQDYIVGKKALLLQAFLRD